MLRNGAAGDFVLCCFLPPAALILAASVMPAGFGRCAFFAIFFAGPFLAIVTRVWERRARCRDLAEVVSFFTGLLFHATSHLVPGASTSVWRACHGCGRRRRGAGRPIVGRLRLVHAAAAAGGGETLGVAHEEADGRAHCPQPTHAVCAPRSRRAAPAHRVRSA